MKNHKLDKEEKRLLKSIENDEWESVPNVKEKIKEIRQAAANTVKKMRKDTSITIRISSADLNGIKKVSETEGMPYQTLITSVLHKYVTSKDKDQEPHQRPSKHGKLLNKIKCQNGSKTNGNRLFSY